MNPVPPRMRILSAAGGGGFTSPSRSPGRMAAAAPTTGLVRMKSRRLVLMRASLSTWMGCACNFRWHPHRPPVLRSRMDTLPHLFEQNRAWAKAMQERDPSVFENLSKLQAPEYLWIGCSDSRVPANEIAGLAPGEMFVHRNVGNVMVHSDLNCLSVLQFAIDRLKVKHVIVCGHYGCGGVAAALEPRRHGLVDHWLRHIRDVRHRHHD